MSVYVSLKRCLMLLLSSVFILIIFQSSLRSSSQENMIHHMARSIMTSKVVLLGEATHAVVPPYHLLHALICKTGLEIDYIGIELGSNNQAAIDSYFQGAGKIPDFPGSHYKTSESKKAWSNIYADLFRINEKRRKSNKPPIQVIALDKPQPTVKSEKEWFLSRDQYMYSVLNDRTHQFQGKGILYLGAAHLAKSSYKMPTEVSKRFGIEEIILTPLGARLNSNKQLKNKLVYYWIQSVFPKKFMHFIPKDWHVLYQVLGKLKTLISTQSKDFLKAEEAVGANSKEGLRLSTHFDFAVRLGAQFVPVDHCQAIDEEVSRE